MEIIDDKEKWDLVIEAKRKLFDLQLSEVIKYRDLILLFVKRDFVTQYKQTILGPIWFIINPLFSTVIYSFIFGNLAQIGTDGIPHILFYYSGTMLWTFFTGCFNDASNIFINNAGLFSKVYFPRLTVPISNVISNLTRILVQFCFFLLFFIYYSLTDSNIKFSFFLVLFPLILLWISVLGTGLGMIVSSLTTKYRDLKQLVSFGLSLLMYATPVVYPLSKIPEKFTWLNIINPLNSPIELFRIFYFSKGYVSLLTIVNSIALTSIIFLVGIILFSRNERTFVDVV